MQQEQSSGSVVTEKMDQANDVISARASDAVEQGRGAVQRQVGQRSAQLGSQIGATSHTIRQVAEQARIDGNDQQARLAEEAAKRAERFSCYLGEVDPERLMADAEDFARHDLLAVDRANPRVYGHAPLWIDTGTEDFFRQADTEFAHLLEAGGEDVTFHVWPGGHAEQHWDGHFPQYIQFFARALARCGGSGVGFPAS